jgi:hypothetical protein
MDTCSTSIKKQLRRLEQLVSSERMSADDLRMDWFRTENIIDRIDAIQAIARDLHQPAQLTPRTQTAWKG